MPRVKTSRDLNDLQPQTRERAKQLLLLAGEAGLTLLIYCTLRPLDEQARLYRQGRSLATIQDKADELSDAFGRPDLAEILMGVGPQHGRIVTSAAPGQSYHNYGLAIDGVVLRGGKPVWGHTSNEDLSYWTRYGELAEDVGFKWAGRWRGRSREFPHLQEPGVDWRELIRTHPGEA